MALRHLAATEELWPKSGFLPLPLVGRDAAAGKLYLAEMAVAANFATLNRLALSLIVISRGNPVLEGGEEARSLVGDRGD